MEEWGHEWWRLLHGERDWCVCVCVCTFSLRVWDGARLQSHTLHLEVKKNTHNVSLAVHLTAVISTPAQLLHWKRTHAHTHTQSHAQTFKVLWAAGKRDCYSIDAVFQSIVLGSSFTGYCWCSCQWVMSTNKCDKNIKDTQDKDPKFEEISLLTY